MTNHLCHKSKVEKKKNKRIKTTPTTILKNVYILNKCLQVHNPQITGLLIFDPADTLSSTAALVRRPAYLNDSYFSLMLQTLKKVTAML